MDKKALKAVIEPIAYKAHFSLFSDETLFVQALQHFRNEFERLTC